MLVPKLRNSFPNTHTQPLCGQMFTWETRFRYTRRFYIHQQMQPWKWRKKIREIHRGNNNFHTQNFSSSQELTFNALTMCVKCKLLSFLGIWDRNRLFQSTIFCITHSSSTSSILFEELFFEFFTFPNLSYC